MIESLCYLFLINVILVFLCNFTINLNNAYQLEDKLFNIDDSFNFSKYNLKNDLKNIQDIKIKDKSLIIKKILNGDMTFISYKVSENSKGKLGFFRTENFKRSEEIASHIHQAEFYLKKGIDLNTKTILLVVKLYAKIDNINDSIKFMLRL